MSWVLRKRLYRSHIGSCVVESLKGIQMEATSSTEAEHEAIVFFVTCVEAQL